MHRDITTVVLVLLSLTCTALAGTPLVTFASPSGDIFKRTEVIATVQWNDEDGCQATRGRSLVVLMDPDNSVPAITFTPNATTMALSSFSISFADLDSRIYVNYKGNATIINKCAASNFASKAKMYYCEQKPAVAPTLISPRNNSEIPVLVRANRFQFSPTTLENFGSSDCTTSQTNSLKIFIYSRDGKTLYLQYNVLGTNLATPYYIENYIDLEDISHAAYIENNTIGTNFNKSMELAWTMEMMIGSTKVSIPLINVTVANIDCNDIACVKSKGKCLSYEVICDCYDGFEGSDCSKRSNLSAGALAGIVIGSIVFFAIAAGLSGILIFRHQVQKKRRITLTAPDFNLIRFSTVKMPEFPPEMNPDFSDQNIENLLLADTNMNVIWNVCKHTPVTESDNLCKTLVYAYERHKLGLQFIMNLISKEVEESTEDAETLFRANSISTKAFKYYSKMVGLPYLFKTIAVLLQGILRDIAEQEGKKDDDDVQLFKVQYELDPEKVEESGDENINVLMLQLTCQKFLVQILRSSNDCPGEFKQLCAHIKEVIGQRFPNYVYKAIGAFIFLRFYNTGITVPESFGLMQTPPKQSARRQLILLSKVLQNLANGVKFGAKETFMTKLNGFIISNQEKLKAFYDKISIKGAPLSETINVGDNIYKPCLANIYMQLTQAYAENPEIFRGLPDQHKV
eukprot:TRINITY_DN591_c0_g1_i2.p1 TRINITY_DN591_c0_g1~~TRINITY_DN591_c0_g1_i2.p1  ORF type:complete len:693 (-),score=124.54 TRINITY_DN591_c0_g1_i2:35-2089(-)